MVTPKGAGETRTELLVIGAGPYGLATAAYAKISDIETLRRAAKGMASAAAGGLRAR